MTHKKTILGLVALIALLIGFLAGLWFGARILASGQDAQLSNLSGAERDQYVALVAGNYAATDNKDEALAQLARLESPNLELLVSGVLERAAKQGENAGHLAALANLALDVGAPRAALAQYLPPATPEAAPTRTPAPPPAVDKATPTRAPATAAPDSATPLPPSATPTELPAATATSLPTPEPTALPEPQARASQAINVRSGPGTLYPVVAGLAAETPARIVARNAAGDWWQIQLEDETLGWVYGAIVNVTNAENIPEATDIPPVPATATPAATAIPTQPAGPTFRVVSRHLWTVVENGGEYAGESIHCGLKHELHIRVIDAAGNPINGVTLQSLYNNEEHVTGDYGPGGTQWVLFAPGNGVKVTRDVDGSAVSSENMDAPTDPRKISTADMISGGFCHDDASCEVFKQGVGCFGHYSWDVVFQRTY